MPVPTIDQLHRLCAGCEAVTLDNGAYRFDRLPPDLASHYREAEGSRIRLECPSGVRLRVITDASAMRLGFRYGAAARPFYQACVIEQGQEPRPVGPVDQTDAWEGEVELGGGWMELWLPHLVRTDLSLLDFLGATHVEPAPPRSRRWLALGDSITQGMTTPLPTETTLSITARALDLDLQSFGIGGAKLTDFIAHATLDWPYDLLTIAYGTNDFNQSFPLDDFAHNARTLVTRQAAAHPDAVIVLITPLPWAGRTTPNAAGIPFDAYRKTLAEVAADVPGVHLLHGPDLVPDDPAMFVDNVHPNRDGMAEYARNLIAALQTMLP